MEKVAVHAVGVIQHFSEWKSWNRTCLRGQEKCACLHSTWERGGLRIVWKEACWAVSEDFIQTAILLRLLSNKANFHSN